MQVPVKFDGGPLHGSVGYVRVLDEVLLFFDKRQRQIFMYKRTDELQYVFAPDESIALSEKYDEATEKLGAGAAEVAWERTEENSEEPLDSD